MIESQLFEDPRSVALLLAAGAGLITLLAWLLVRPRTLSGWADDIGGLAWLAVRHVRRVFVVLASVTLALTGIALLVLPGPGTLFLGASLGLLATEFVWARRWIQRLKRRLESLGNGAWRIIGDRRVRDVPADGSDRDLPREP